MKHPLACALALAIATTATGHAFAAAQQDAKPTSGTTVNEAVVANPFFADSTLPLKYPAFDKIQDSHFAPAFDRGMAEELAEVDAIANNAEPATFDNTILALEKSGQMLTRSSAVFYNLVGADTNDARKKIDADYAPKFAAHGDAIRLNPKLFARIKAL